MQTLKLIFDTFGSTVFVPAMLFVISLCMRVSVKKAFSSALMAGVGLTGFTLVTNGYAGIMAPLVSKLVNETGLVRPVMDMGWQSTATTAYSTEVGMLFIGVGLALQFILFLVGWTDVFMPSDLWNNYSFIIWGSLLYVATGSMLLAFGCMILQNLYVLLFAEVIQKRWSTYFGYPGCAMTAPHHMANVPIAIALDLLLNLLGADKVNIRPESIRKKLGVMGEPMFIGLFVGLLFGVIGNFKSLGTLSAWGNIAQVGIMTAAVMAIFPRIASIFAGAFTPLTDASKKAVNTGKKSRNVYLAVNDALGYGDPAALTSGLLMIPMALILSFIVPGNLVVPMMGLLSFPYRCEVHVCINNGNIFKTVIAMSIMYSAMLLIASANAPLYTEVAKAAGIQVPETAVMVTGFIATTIFLNLIFQIFKSKNPIAIAASVVVYFVLYFWYKKNKLAVDEFLEKNAVAYKTKLAAKEATLGKAE